MPDINEQQTQEVLALSQMMVMLTQLGGNYSKQRLLKLLSMREYIDDGANKVAQMWVDGKLSKDDYHELIGYYRSVWSVLSRIIEEDFELKQDNQLHITTLKSSKNT